MRRLYYLILSSLLLLGVHTSCTKDSSNVTPGIGEEEEEIVISTGGTRYTPEAVTDSSYTVFRILVFDKATQECKHNYYYGYTTDTIFRIKIKPGIYDLVFIANEISDQNNPNPNNASQQLQDFGNVMKNYMQDLDNIMFNRRAFDANKHIPMAGIKRNIEVLGPMHWIDHYDDNDPATYKTYNKDDADYKPMPVSIVRLGVRVDVVLKTLKEEIKDEVDGITFINIPEEVPLLPTYEETSKFGNPICNAEVPTGNTNSAPYTYTEILGDSLWTKLEDESYIWTKTRVIMPSAVFLNPTKAANAISLRLRLKTKNMDDVPLGINTPRTTPVPPTEGSDLPPKNDYTLPRNTRLTFEGNIRDYSLYISISVRGWTEAKSDGTIPPIHVPD
ncbi:hypothetical protein [Bacteroides sp. 51]|uniref:hypothetical protein n=1 Tax=Bacteroides sp. 51 TaxID=2302938 RepID=UPI0013D361C2|nr:hypothetical protein [Bacteroides sp. 51]NDV80637.1 hypothetical protein [Bacteroides sp. 51]